MNKLLIVKNNLLEISLIIVYVFIGVLSRTVLHIGDNVEFVTGLSLAAGYFLKNKKLSFIVPFCIMFLSDAILGNTIIIFFTWSAFLIAPLFSYLTKYLNTKFRSIDFIKNLTFSSSISGVVFTLFFFLWTNAGVVLVSNMYSKNITGLIESYINGLPFLYNQLLGNMIITPMIFIFTNLYLNTKKSTNMASLNLKVK